MFILRREHEDAFGKAGLQRFAKKAVRILRRRQPEITLAISDETILKFVHEWMELARSFGLKTERQMANYCEAGLLLSCRGIDIRNDSKILSLIRSIGNDPNVQAEQIRQYAVGLHTSNRSI